MQMQTLPMNKHQTQSWKHQMKINSLSRNQIMIPLI